jgi:hypothetical protein
MRVAVGTIDKNALGTDGTSRLGIKFVRLSGFVVVETDVKLACILEVIAGLLRC